MLIRNCIIQIHSTIFYFSLLRLCLHEFVTIQSWTLVKKKKHLDVMNTKDIKFTLTWSSAGEFRLFSPLAHLIRGVSRRPLFLRLWRHCWSFSSPLLLGFLLSLSLSFAGGCSCFRSSPSPFTCFPRQQSPIDVTGLSSVHKIFSANPPTHAAKQLQCWSGWMNRRRGSNRRFQKVSPRQPIQPICKNIHIYYRKGSGRCNKMHPKRIVHINPKNLHPQLKQSFIIIYLYNFCTYDGQQHSNDRFVHDVYYFWTSQENNIAIVTHRAIVR